MFSSTPVLMIIFLFTFVPLILAEVARNKSVPTLEDFFLQSRKMSTVMTFFTVYATWMSAFAFLGAGGYFYKNGPVYMTAIAWDAFFGILFMVVGKRIWYYGKNHNYITPTDFFNDIFRSKALNLLITGIMVIFTIPYLQIQLSGGAYIIEIASGGLIPWRLSGLIFYLIIIIYLWAGGLRAVALTDIFYGICIFVSMMVIGFFLVDKAGGIEYVFQTITAKDVRNVTLPGPDGDSGAFLWISLFITVPVGAIMGPQLWIRCYAPEKKQTFNIIPLLVCLAAIQCIGPLLAGSAGILLIKDIVQPDKIIPVMLLRYGNTIITALLLCGIASAALSTANSQIHALAAIYTIDVHKKYFKRDASDQKLVAVGKWAVLLISGLAYLLLLQNPGLLIDTGTIALGGTAQVIVPTLGALYWKKSNANAAALGLVAGIIVISLVTFAADFNASYSAVIGLGCNALIFIIGSLSMKTNMDSKERILNYKNNYESDNYFQKN